VPVILPRRPRPDPRNIQSWWHKGEDFRPTGGQLALDAGVPIDQVSQSMRHASTVTTERYYCRARTDPAFARVNEAYDMMFKPEPAISAEND